MKSFTAFLCGLALGMSGFLRDLFYWIVIAGLIAYIVHLRH